MPAHFAVRLRNQLLRKQSCFSSSRRCHHHGLAWPCRMKIQQKLKRKLSLNRWKRSEEALCTAFRRMGNILKSVSGRLNISTDTCEDYFKAPEVDVVVLQDYPSADVSEPIYRIGEKLKLVSQEAYWWRVRSVQTGQENIIPVNHAAKVYHGWLFEGVERQKAEELLGLPGNRVGSFLVRESSRERGMYSLSVKHRSVKHYRIYRLDNSWYYISPSLTFQCLEDMINHYSDFADGLCSVLTSPCLSDPVTPSATSPEAPPVVMRRNFDWKKVDRRQLASNNNCDDGMLSYGVRNSIAAYLSFSDSPETTCTRAENRRKKSKSLYALPESAFACDDE